VRRGTWLIVAVAVGVALAASFRVVSTWNHLAEFTAGPGEQVSVRGEFWCDPRCGVTYLVTKTGTVIVNEAFIGSTDAWGLRFANIAPSGSGMVAVVERSAPDVLLAVHDFPTGRTWPGGDHRERDAAGAALLEKLQAIRPGTYILGGTVSVLRPLKIR
jgi:hypothetical protein